MARFVITVDFYLHAGTLEPFLILIKENARTSLAEEPGCDRFDVLIEKNSPNHIVLYEIYKDRAAFDFHLKSPHIGAATLTPSILFPTIGQHSIVQRRSYWRPWH